MLQELISRREDLKRLVEEGYELEVRSGYLVLHRVPYVTSERTVKYGQLVCPLAETGAAARSHDVLWGRIPLR